MSINWQEKPDNEGYWWVKKVLIDPNKGFIDSDKSIDYFIVSVDKEFEYNKETEERIKTGTFKVWHGDYPYQLDEFIGMYENYNLSFQKVEQPKE